jgi:hypothetical protein
LCCYLGLLLQLQGALLVHTSSADLLCQPGDVTTHPARSGADVMLQWPRICRCWGCHAAVCNGPDRLQAASMQPGLHQWKLQAYASFSDCWPVHCWCILQVPASTVPLTP